MKSFWPLLIISAILLGYFLASLLGFETPASEQPWNYLLAAIPWILFFLVLHAGFNGWRSVRVFLLAYVGWKFTALGYNQAVYGMPTSQLLYRAIGGILVSCFLFWCFWRAPASETDKAAGSEPND